MSGMSPILFCFSNLCLRSTSYPTLYRSMHLFTYSAGACNGG
ncbi:hypothetical protein BACCOP_04085 [Phocaeicola coprocola DSM 17136]|uniref:Uncharacterized protein n=1 Tax=Phocaeicola coprocola DSM 17136 TaxID=470145 RepID=B3JQC7_9BACT|nr:hypothetical protein BACCOP_04085 [Phocaeicola coprocola DSM 17136]